MAIDLTFGEDNSNEALLRKLEHHLQQGTSASDSSSSSHRDSSTSNSKEANNMPSTTASSPHYDISHFRPIAPHSPSMHKRVFSRGSSPALTAKPIYDPVHSIENSTILAPYINHGTANQYAHDSNPQTRFSREHKKIERLPAIRPMESTSRDSANSGWANVGTHASPIPRHLGSFSVRPTQNDPPKTNWNMPDALPAMPTNAHENTMKRHPSRKLKVSDSAFDPAQMPLPASPTFPPHNSYNRRQHPTPKPVFSVQDQVADILSTFSNSPSSGASPATVDPLNDISLSLLLGSTTAPSLPAMIYGLAVANPSFFSTLREAVPAEYCAMLFFRKMELQVHTVMRRHTEWLFERELGLEYCPAAATATSHNPDAQLSEEECLAVPDERWCDRALRRRVEMVRQHLEMRAPLGREARERALGVLVRVLVEAVTVAGEDELDVVPHPEPTRKRVCARPVRVDTVEVGVHRRILGYAAQSANASSLSSSASSPVSAYTPPAMGLHHGSPAHQQLQPRMVVEHGSTAMAVVDVLADLADVAGPAQGRLVRMLGRIRTVGAREEVIRGLQGVIDAASVRSSSYNNSRAGEPATVPMATRPTTEPHVGIGMKRTRSLSIAVSEWGTDGNATGETIERPPSRQKVC